MRRIFFILLFTIFCADSFSQETLFPLTPTANAQAKKSGNTLVQLPFFDDFSYQQTIPDQEKWCDKNVYINDGYAVNAPSPGVASFDALDEFGAIYKHIDYGNVYAADTLMSNKIDLNGKTDVVLSFLYQLRGTTGGTLEKEDKLELQFYSQPTDEWVTIHEIRGDSVRGEAHNRDDFKSASIAINEPNYLTSDFRMRFVNHVSLGKGENENNTERGNSDIWNLDYIYINDNRPVGDTIVEDVAFITVLPSLLVDYESVPWSHYKHNPTGLMRTDAIDVSVMNYGSGSTTINTFDFKFVDIWGSEPVKIKEAGVYNIDSGDKLTVSFIDDEYGFPSSDADSALYQLKVEMTLDDSDIFTKNNTTVHNHVFLDYYAYDDGTAEAGYGLNSTAYGQVAYQFKNHKPGDQLWGVDLFLTQTINSANLKYFYIVVWEDDNGKPGNILYRQHLAEQLAYTKGINKFSSFRLHEHNNDLADTSAVVGSTFYIGWEQTSEGLIGVGFDSNNANLREKQEDTQNDKLFFNVANAWENSSYQGNLMLRPVFSNRKSSLTSVEQPSSNKHIGIYPNPAQETTTLLLPNYQGIAQVQVFDLSGRLQHEVQLHNDQKEISVASLSNGLYMVRVFNNGRLLGQTKLFVQRTE